MAKVSIMAALGTSQLAVLLSLIVASSALIIAAVPAAASDVPGDPESLPGWLGASHSVATSSLRRSKAGRLSGSRHHGRLRGSSDGISDSTGSVPRSVVRVEYDDDGRNDVDAAAEQRQQRPQSRSGALLAERRVIQLSAENPRAYLFKNFLTDEECDFIIERAKPDLKRSTVVSTFDANSEVSEIRTSSGMFISKGESPTISTIEQRISEWTLLPVANQEAMQVLRYTKGQKYVPHHDYFSGPKDQMQGGERYATVLMYLSTPKKGGETVFSMVKDRTPKDDSWSDCAKGLLAVKPQKGDALLFFSMKPDGSPDEFSMHYACPVVEGVKWSAPKWIHVGNYDVPLGVDPDSCEDTHKMCAEWAASGECEKNPLYMKGDTGWGTCRLSCKVCTPTS